jgi:urease accessory protein
MIPGRLGPRALAAAPLSLSAGPAAAHGGLPGGGGFLSGALHPFAAVEHLVLLLALGLLAGLLPRERRPRALALLLAGLLAGLAATVTGRAGLLPAGTVAAAILALALIGGLLLALDPALPAAAVPGVALAAGLAVGADTEVGGASALAAAAGVVVGAFLIVLDAAALSAWATRPPLPIARRVAGSWIAAIAIMLLALAISSARGVA